MASPNDSSPDELAIARAMLDELQDTQWYDPAALRAYQSELLRTLLDHAVRHTPLYRERYGGLSRNELRELGVEDLGRLPLLTRADLQTREADLRAARVPPEHGDVFAIVTSGSTGSPVRTWTTSHATRWTRAFKLRDHYWHERDATLPVCAIRARGDGKGQLPDGFSYPDWGEPITLFHRTGPSHLLQVGSPIAEQAAWLQRCAPGYLISFPTNVGALARHFIEHGLKLPSLRQVMTISEPVNEELRAGVRDAWGVKVTDEYSSREVGSITIQCPAHEHHHVTAENVVVEVLDGEGRPCAPGEIGRVVVTALREYAMPLIRYDIGDFAEVGPTCDCGRGLPVLRRVIGRTRNRVKLPGGGEVWPSTGYRMLAETKEIEQIRFVQNELERIDVEIVARRPLSELRLAELREVWRTRFRHPFEFAVHYVDAIPRGPGGKFEDVLCNL